MQIAATTKPHPARKTQRETRAEVSDPERAMARARRIQAATSLTAAADMASRPISVVRSLSSAKIRANTGKAVIERATPMKMRNATLSTPLEIVALRTNEEPMPRANGSEIPARAIPKAFLPVLRRDLVSISKPARKRKKRRPRLARVSRTVKLFFGNTASRKALERPRRDGPSIIPPCRLIND